MTSDIPNDENHDDNEDIGGFIVPPQFVDELLNDKPRIMRSHITHVPLDTDTTYVPLDTESLHIENKEVDDDSAVMNRLASLSKAKVAALFARIKKEYGISDAPMWFKIKGEDEITP